MYKIITWVTYISLHVLVIDWSHRLFQATLICSSRHHPAKDATYQIALQKPETRIVQFCLVAIYYYLF